MRNSEERSDNPHEIFIFNYAKFSSGLNPEDIIEEELEEFSKNYSSIHSEVTYFIFYILCDSNTL